MIISKISGGLGNQMFQYALGRALALASGEPLKLDISGSKKDKLRDFLLDQYQIKAKPLSKLERKLRNSYGHLGLVKALVPAAKCITVVEDGLPYKPEISRLRTPVYLNGYWQSEKYFNHIADTIRSDFKPVEPFTQAREHVRDQIIQSSAAVSVHVRRGDYVTNAKTNQTHGTCAPEWYATAMSLMAERFEQADFFVFSDDISWARENLPAYPKTIFVEPQPDGKDVQDVCLMALCHSHITANSSFSWWGAWLNPRPDKHVIAPSRWFKSPDLDARDIVPETWQRL